MNDIRDGKETSTWCGFPHHLLVPRLSIEFLIVNDKNECQWIRSADFDPQKENLGGKNFTLMAFITNAEDDVVVGLDGVEHV